MHRFLPLLALVLAPPAVEAKCAMMGLAPAVLATSSVVVVGYEDVQNDRLGAGDVAVRTDWKFRDGGQLVTPVIESLAPGLAVYRLPAAATGTVTLEDAAKKSLATLTGVAKPAGHKAPRAKQIKLEQRFGRRPFARVQVELDGAAPDRAVALVLADAKGKPLSWGRVTAGATTIRVLDHARCRVLPNGTVNAKLDQRVTLFWVDDTGAKSPVSAAYAVKGTPAKDDGE
jgi:hypothetical protein